MTDTTDEALREIFGDDLREGVSYQDGENTRAPLLVFADADYEVGDGTCGLHPDGKRANEPAIVYVRADTIIALRQERDEARAESDMLEEEAEKTEVQLAALRLERDDLRKRLTLYEGDHIGPVSFTGMVDDMAGALAELARAGHEREAHTEDDLGIRLQKAAEKHCDGIDLPHDLGLRLVSVLFQSDGNEEDRWCEAMENACPACGGSGHKDDARATVAARDRAKIAEGMRRAAEICDAEQEATAKHNCTQEAIGAIWCAKRIRAEAEKMERGER